MRASRTLWFVRILGIAVLTLAHLFVMAALIGSSLGGQLARGQHGEELEHEYRNSAEGRRTEFALDVLQWPIVKPIEIVESRLSGSTVRSTPWRMLKAASFYGNSLVWGIGIWVLLEVLARGAWAALGRRSSR